MQKKSFICEALLIIVLPAILLAGFFVFFKSGLQMESQDQSFEQRHKYLRMVKREGIDSLFIQKRLNLMYGMLAEENLGAATIQKFLGRADSEGLGFVNFRFFDARGQHIPLKGESDKFRVFIGKIFAALVQPELEGKSSMLSSHASFFEAFLGKVKPASMLNEKSSLAKVSLSGKPGWFYWNSFYSDSAERKFLGGMVAFFENSAIPRDFALKRLLFETHRDFISAEGAFCGLIYLNKSDADYSPGTDFMSPDKLRKKLVAMRKNLVSQVELENGVLTAIAVDPEKSLIYYSPEKPGFFEKLGFILTLLFMAAVIAALRGMFNYFAVAKHSQPTVRSRLKLAISATLALPLLVMLLASFYLIYLHQRVVTQNLTDSMTSLINAVDERYIDALDELERDYIEFAAAIEKTQSPGQYGLIAKDLYEKNGFKQMFVLSGKSRLKYSFPEEVAYGGIINKLLPTLGQRLFASRDNGKNNSWRSRVNDMVFEAMSENLSELLGDPESRASFMKIFEKRDQIVEFWLANQKFYVFTHFLENGRFEKSPELLVIWQDAGTYSSHYLKQQVRKHLLIPEHRQPIRLAMKARRADQPPYPGELAKYSFSLDMFEKVVSTENQQFAVVAKDGGNWLVVAAPMKRVGGYVIFAMQSLKPLERENLIVRILLLLLFLASILVAWRMFRILAPPELQEQDQ